MSTRVVYDPKTWWMTPWMCVYEESFVCHGGVFDLIGAITLVALIGFAIAVLCCGLLNLKEKSIKRKMKSDD